MLSKELGIIVNRGLRILLQNKSLTPFLKLARLVLNCENFMKETRKHAQNTLRLHNFMQHYLDVHVGGFVADALCEVVQGQQTLVIRCKNCLLRSLARRSNIIRIIDKRQLVYLRKCAVNDAENRQVTTFRCQMQRKRTTFVTLLCRLCPALDQQLGHTELLIMPASILYGIV